MRMDVGLGLSERIGQEAQVQNYKEVGEGKMRMS